MHKEHKSSLWSNLSVRSLVCIFLFASVWQFAMACDMFAALSGPSVNDLNSTSGFQRVEMRDMLEDLRATGSINNDGCGFTMYFDGEDITFRDDAPITNSWAYYEVHDNWFTASNTIDIQVLMAHARNSTSGSGGGVHPFNWDSRLGDNKTYSFMHNGQLDVSSIIYKMNTLGFDTAWIQQAYMDCHDVTNPPAPSAMVDSELAFYFIMGMAERCRNLETGMSQALKQINTCSGLSTMNFVLSDGTTMYAYKYKPASSSSTNMIYYKMIQGTYPHLMVQTMSNNFYLGQGVELANDALIKYSTTDTSPTTITSFSANAGEKVNFASGTNWISIPVMDGASINAATYFNTIPAGSFTNIKHGSSTYTYAQLSSLTLYRDKGYELTLSSPVSNFLMKGYQTKAAQPVNVQLGTNWIGYFIKQSADPLSAMSTIIQYVSRIEAKNWVMYRGKYGEWITVLGQGATGTLDYGQLYKVTYSGATTSFTYQVAGYPMTSYNHDNSNYDDNAEKINEETPAVNSSLVLGIAPNPARDWANISYTISEKSNVKVDIYNVRGQLVRSFDEPSKASGTYSILWDGKDLHGSKISNGVYVVRAKAGNNTKTTRLIKID